MTCRLWNFATLRGFGWQARLILGLWLGATALNLIVAFVLSP